MGSLRPCSDDEGDRMLQIINAAALAYRGAIPADCWHEPYMSADAFAAERARGVRFQGYVEDGRLVGVMGFEPVRNVHLIRHAYVDPEIQGRGIGGKLLRHFMAEHQGQFLVGTWTDAIWAIRFYQHHGFALPPEPMQQLLLRTYWTIPARMAERSVALASPVLGEGEIRQLVAEAQA